MQSSSPWTPAGEPAPIGHASTALMVVEGQAFYLSSADGDVRPGLSHGLFVGDTRFLDQAELSINDQPLELLTTDQSEAFSAIIVLRPRTDTGQPSRDVLVVRRRYLGLAFREDIELRNYGPEPLDAAVTLEVDGDFADLFAVKEGRAVHSHRTSSAQGDRLLLTHDGESVHRAVEISFHGPGVVVFDDGGRWQVQVPAHGSVTLCWDATVSFGSGFLTGHTGCGERPDRMESARRARAWGGELPALSTPDARLRQAVGQSLDDLGALRLFDPTLLRPVIAAGAPWFMTLFGRDSLLSAWMALPLGPDLPLGVLEALAMLQGTKVDDTRDEQPGRILHELRFTRASTLALLAGEPYFGSADSSPLFVMLLGEVARWGAPIEAVRALLPAADAALAWIEEFGDRDGDGFVEYLRGSPVGLANQGWKDSGDGVRYGDGRVATAPLALCEVQAYVYGAYRARADLARWLGEPAGTADDMEHRATVLRQAFNAQYWMEEAGTFALALDADKRQVDAVSSNPGHCLWTGIVADELAPSVGASLVSPPMWTGWGVRTLAADNPAFNPMSYHCGSVWPHDNAIAVAGLTRYGLYAEAQLVAGGLLDAAATEDGRLPELFCGIDRAEVTVPVSYPTSCQPQAWAAASPLLLLRSLLGFEPNAPKRVLRIRPRAIPDAWRPLAWEGIHLAGQRVGVAIGAQGTSVSALPEGWSVDAVG